LNKENHGVGEADVFIYFLLAIVDGAEIVINIMIWAFIMEGGL
jgi:hypothetical protein